MTTYYIRKPYDLLGERQQRRRKLKIKKDISNMANGINYKGPKITSIQFETESHNQVKIQMTPQTQSESSDNNND